MKRIVVLSDYQVPYQAGTVVNTIHNFIEDYQPDEIWIVGDWIDQPEPSRWSRGTAGEYAPTLQKSVNQSVDLLADLRDIMKKKPIHFKAGNHDIRIEKYVSSYAPALRSLNALTLPEMLQLDKLNITLHRKPAELAPNWLLCHGDEGSQSRQAGGTALALARRFGKSVVCGHTHRLGLQAYTTSYNGQINQQLYGFETGNVMRLNKAHYLPGGSGNWQQGFGLLYVEGRLVTPSPVYIERGKFIVEGVMYG
jgi:UDP-2,3-diacylglucosamine pyrophosphatase LpxH